MTLIIGGNGAGKARYVREVLGYGDDQIADGVLSAEAIVILSLHKIVAVKPGQVEALFQQFQGKVVLTCDEVGGGVVPLDPIQRQMREETGRLLILLAKEADTVVRIFCGIPTAIKGSL